MPEGESFALPRSRKAATSWCAASLGPTAWCWRREVEEAHAQLAAMQTQLERAQRTAADAKAEASRAQGTAQKCEAELANVRKQVLAVRERAKDLETLQKVRGSLLLCLQVLCLHACQLTACNPPHACAGRPLRERGSARAAGPA